MQDDKNVYVENPRDSLKTVLELLRTKLQDTKSKHKNHLNFYTLAINNMKPKLKTNNKKNPVTFIKASPPANPAHGALFRME